MEKKMCTLWDTNDTVERLSMYTINDKLGYKQLKQVKFFLCHLSLYKPFRRKG